MKETKRVSDMTDQEVIAELRKWEADYNTPITWQCASNAVRMQADMNRLMRAHKECGRYRTAVAAARMVYAMRSAAVR